MHLTMPRLQVCRAARGRHSLHPPRTFNGGHGPPYSVVLFEAALIREHQFAHLPMAILGFRSERFDFLDNIPVGQ